MHQNYNDWNTECREYFHYDILDIGLFSALLNRKEPFVRFLEQWIELITAAFYLKVQSVLIRWKQKACLLVLGIQSDFIRSKDLKPH